MLNFYPTFVHILVLMFLDLFISGEAKTSRKVDSVTNCTTCVIFLSCSNGLFEARAI